MRRLKVAARQLLFNMMLAVRVCAGKRADLGVVDRVIALLRPVGTGRELVRLGGRGDGGYLVPDDLAALVGCFSPGVDNRAFFEKDLLQRGVPCYLADASVTGAPLDHEMLTFEKKYLGVVDDDLTLSLDRWVAECGAEPGDLVLQMDIEGHELAVLLNVSDSVLRRFRILVVEFHDFEKVFDRVGSRQILAVLDRLSQHYVVAHVHPNNYGGSASAAGRTVPRVLEVSFLRRDRVLTLSPVRQLPHRLDEKNADHLPDVVVPASWYRDADSRDNVLESRSLSRG